MAAATSHERQRIFVKGNIDARLADPSDFQRDQGTHQLLCSREVGDNVVIDEKDHLAPLPHLSQLRNHLIHRPMILRGIEERLHRTEVAFESATARNSMSLMGK